MRLRPVVHGGVTSEPLTGQPGPVQAYKMTIPAGTRTDPDPRTHEGYEWLYVLSGRLRLVLAEHDIVIGRGRRPSSTRASRTGSATSTTGTSSC